MFEPIHAFEAADQKAYQRALGAREVAGALKECADPDEARGMRDRLLTHHLSGFRAQIDTAMFAADRSPEAQDAKLYAEEYVQRHIGAIDHLHSVIDPVGAASKPLRRSDSLNRIVREMRGGTAEPSQYRAFFDPDSRVRAEPTEFDRGYQLASLYAGHQSAPAAEAGAMRAAGVSSSDESGYSNWPEVLAGLSLEEREANADVLEATGRLSAADRSAIDAMHEYDRQTSTPRPRPWPPAFGSQAPLDEEARLVAAHNARALGSAHGLGDFDDGVIGWLHSYAVHPQEDSVTLRPYDRPIHRMSIAQFVAEHLSGDWNRYLRLRKE